MGCDDNLPSYAGAEPAAEPRTWQMRTCNYDRMMNTPHSLVAKRYLVPMLRSEQYQFLHPVVMMSKRSLSSNCGSDWKIGVIFPTGNSRLMWVRKRSRSSRTSAIVGLCGTRLCIHNFEPSSLSSIAAFPTDPEPSNLGPEAV